MRSLILPEARKMSHEGALVVVPVESQPQPAVDVPPFLIFLKCKAPELLDCHACHRPLKPPIFTCDDGHLMCSSCRGAHGDDCGRVAAHCRLADAYAGAVRVLCDYVKFGCEAGLVVYHDAADHRRACSHAPIYCPERAGPQGGAGGCDFAGSRRMLVDHISTDHSRPTIVVRYGQPGKLSLPLTRGWHVLVGEEDTADRHPNVFLVVVAERDKGAAVSLVCIRPNDGAPPQFSYKLAVEHAGSGAKVTFELPVMASNSLSGGTPCLDEVTSLKVAKAYVSGDDAVLLSILIDKLVPPPCLPPPVVPTPAPATAAVFKFTATNQEGSKKRKSTNPRKL